MMRNLISVLLLSLLACSSLPASPKLDVDDCLARLDCHVVKVDNSTSTRSIDFRFNNRKYGNIESFSTGTFTVNDNELVHGKCAIASVRFYGDHNAFITSEEQCIRNDQYYQIRVVESPYRYVFLVTFPIRQ